MKQIVYTASILASVLLVNCGPKMTESGSHSGENIALTDVDPMPFAESISAEELKEMLATSMKVRVVQRGRKPTPAGSWGALPAQWYPGTPRDPGKGLGARNEHGCR